MNSISFESSDQRHMAACLVEKLVALLRYVMSPKITPILLLTKWLFSGFVCLLLRMNSKNSFFSSIYSSVLNQQHKILNNTVSHACIYGNDVS